MTADQAVSIGERIQQRRKEAELSLNALAEASGVSKGYISQLENGGAANPSIDTLKKIAEALGMAPQDLLAEPTRPAAGARRLPRGLAAFLQERETRGKPLHSEDVEMLRGISYRGKTPTKADDWAFLYETILRVIK